MHSTLELQARPAAVLPVRPQLGSELAIAAHHPAAAFFKQGHKGTTDSFNNAFNNAKHLA